MISYMSIAITLINFIMSSSFSGWCVAVPDGMPSFEVSLAHQILRKD
jgi:hypothetical protein